MPVTEIAICKAKPNQKPNRIRWQTATVCFCWKPTGGKYCRFKYRFAGKEKLLAFGTYPEVSLGEAREKRQQARKLGSVSV